MRARKNKMLNGFTFAQSQNSHQPKLGGNNERKKRNKQRIN